MFRYAGHVAIVVSLSIINSLALGETIRARAENLECGSACCQQSHGSCHCRQARSKLFGLFGARHARGSSGWKPSACACGYRANGGAENGSGDNRGFGNCGFCYGGKITCRSEQYAPDLFYNFYVAPTCEALNVAGMYSAPLPTPAIVQRTYYTYQPFLPHEYMYKHKRSYHRYYNFNGGLNRTRVTYTPNALESIRQVWHWAIEPPR